MDNNHGLQFKNLFFNPNLTILLTKKHLKIKWEKKYMNFAKVIYWKP